MKTPHSQPIKKGEDILDKIKKSLAPYEALMAQPVNKRGMETSKHELTKIVAEKYLSGNGQKYWRIMDTNGNILEQEISTENLDEKWSYWE